jgi:hypothetical protein
MDRGLQWRATSSVLGSEGAPGRHLRVLVVLRERTATTNTDKNAQRSLQVAVRNLNSRPRAAVQCCFQPNRPSSLIKSRNPAARGGVLIKVDFKGNDRDNRGTRRYRSQLLREAEPSPLRPEFRHMKVLSRARLSRMRAVRSIRMFCTWRPCLLFAPIGKKSN